jgi:uncharacterized protein with PQ loop repeat
VVDFLGAVGVTLLALCALPQAWRSWQRGHSRGVSSWLLWPWFVGEVLTFVYVAVTQPDGLLLANYGANAVMVAVILRYKVWPK